MFGREAKEDGRRKIGMAVLIISMLLTGVTAGAALGAEAVPGSDDSEVEISYLNDASVGEEVLWESAFEEGIVSAGNYTDISSGYVSIEGVEDQIWTGDPVTLPNLKVSGPNSWYNMQSYIEGIHYKVTYENNIEPGTAKVILEGIGGGTMNWWGVNGSVTKEFKIIKKESETDIDPVPQNSISLPKGMFFNAGSGASKATYMVTGNNTVSFTKSKAGKKATSAKVPAVVSFNGLTFKVTKVEKKAFSGMSKLKKVTIGEYVTAIGAKAFVKCTRLKKLIVKSTSLQAEKCKNCLKGSSIKTVKVPVSVKKTYKKKIFVKKVCGRKVTVK